MKIGKLDLILPLIALTMAITRWCGDDGPRDGEIGSGGDPEWFTVCDPDRDLVGRPDSCWRCYTWRGAIWATAYSWLGALSSPWMRCSFRRLDVLRGASGLTLPRHWHDGRAGAADGVLLFGISTAYIFSLMALAMLPHHQEPHHSGLIRAITASAYADRVRV
jgi:hypothetical protein